MSQRNIMFLLILSLFLGNLGAQTRNAWSTSEQQYLRQLQNKGGLVAAVPSMDMNPVGSFNQDLVREFAAWLGLELKIIKTNHLELFGDGKQLPADIQTNPALRYDPAVFSKADLVIGAITILPWRSRLMSLHPVIPNAVVLVARKNSGIRSLTDINNRRFLVPRDSSFESLLNSLKQQRALSPQVIPTSIDDNYMKLLNAGQADASLADSLEAFSSIRSLPSLQILEPVSDVHYLCWGLRKGNAALGNILARFMGEATRNGTLGRLIQKHMGASLQDYLALIGFKSGQQVHNLLLTAAERDYLESLQARGSLTVACMVGQDAYLPQDDGSIQGFDYHLARALARTLGIKLQVVPVTDIGTFFAKNGVFDRKVITDQSLRYTPDLFQKVDLYATPLGVNEWRQRLCLMIPVNPYSTVIVGRGADRIKTWRDLQGKRFALAAGGFQEGMIQDLMKQEKFSVDLVYLPPGSAESLDAVVDGKADLTMDGAIFLAHGMEKIRTNKLTVAPLKSGTGMVAWAVARDQPLLASIVGKYLQASQNDGTFAELFKAQKGVDFNFYMSLIN